MTDLDKIRLCAEAMGYRIVYPDESALPLSIEINGIGSQRYNPLCSDAYGEAQCMALVKKFHIQLDKTLRTQENLNGMWIASHTDKFVSEPTDDLNAAVVECVAMMQAAKVAA